MRGAGHGRSYWMQSVEGPSFPPLQGPLDVDVAVVGGGITGLTTAALAAKSGLSVAVLEARTLASGVTGGTTAHATWALDERYHELLRSFGESSTRLIADAHRKAIDTIERLAEEERIDCGFRRVPGWLYAESRKDGSEVEREAAALRQLQLPGTLDQHVPLPFATALGLKLERQAQLHPRAYLLPLARHLSERGVRLHEGTRVLHVEDGKPCRVETSLGTVTARAVVSATHAVVTTRVALHTKLAQYRSYVVAVRVSGSGVPGLFWDTADPYHYLRTQEDPDGPLVLVGGEDHKVGKEDETTRRSAHLEEWAVRRLPWKEIPYRWSAQVVVPVDGLPYVGRSPGSEHVFLATGFAGNGITGGTLAAELLVELVHGRESDLSRLLDPARKSSLRHGSVAKEYVTENVDFPTHLVGDRLTGADESELSAVPRGEGRLVRVGARKLACYRDETGHLTALSPVCTHLGCHVSWNQEARSWDCPCHGSRFDPTGAVLDGPAVGPLRRRSVPEEE